MDADVIFLLYLISIHAPREGGDMATKWCSIARLVFQSTPPARGATARRVAEAEKAAQISIHAPREGGDNPIPGTENIKWIISIHAPREGGDRDDPRQARQGQYFNPRPPRGGRR